MQNNYLYSEDYMDQIINITLHALYSKGINNNNTIRLTNFSFSAKDNLAILNIARIAHNIFGMNVEISTTPFKFFWYNLKYKFKSYCTRTDETEGIDTQKFICDMQNTDQGHHILLFHSIYQAYYERKRHK